MFIHWDLSSEVFTGRTALSTPSLVIHHSVAKKLSRSMRYFGWLTVTSRTVCVCCHFFRRAFDLLQPRTFGLIAKKTTGR